MSYFESKLQGKKNMYSEEVVETNWLKYYKQKYLAVCQLQQPYEEEDIFAPSIYQEDHPNGQEYHRIAAKIVAQLEEE